MHRLAKHQVRFFSPRPVTASLKLSRVKSTQPARLASNLRELDLTDALARSPADARQGPALQPPRSSPNAPPPRPDHSPSATRPRRLPFFRLISGGLLLGALPAWVLLQEDDDNDDTAKPRNRFDVGCFDHPREGWFQDVPNPSFTYTYYEGPYGRDDPRTSIHALMSEEETETYLHKNAKTTVVKRQGNPVTRIDENILPAKTATEDRHAVDIIKRSDLASLLAPKLSFWDEWAARKDSPDSKGEGSDDLVFVSVFDGHMGSAATSHLLKLTMHACMAWMFATGSSCGNGSLLSSQGANVVAKLMRDT